MIRVNGVSKIFDGTPVLSKISFELEREKTFVILGQSGSGKSVLLKILAGLIPADTGDVRIGSKDIGMLFQKNALFDSLSVYENLDFPLREYTELTLSERKRKITEYLSWVGLAGTEKLFPDELSGGMQKRLGIARALIIEPEILFYDEPTAGLDPITSKIIAELILRLKQERKSTVVVVTSDVMRAYQLADTIGLLVPTKDGSELHISGSPAQTRVCADGAIQQFIHGLVDGPLTERGF